MAPKNMIIKFHLNNYFVMDEKLQNDLLFLIIENIIIGFINIAYYEKKIF